MHAVPHDTAPPVIRRLWPGEGPRLRDHLLRLDAESRRTRFGSTVSDAFIVHHAERAFTAGAVMLGAFVDGDLRAAAEIYPLTALLASEAEAAFSVETAYQNHGFGTLLMARVVLAARNRGIRTLQMNCLAYNRPMQQVARKFDAVLAFDSDWVVAELKAPFPTVFSMAEEADAEARGVAGAIVQAQRAAAGRMMRVLLPEPAAA
ncbi:GNAT family N-acetyltransferase [Aquabacter spiritensis]|uniref:Acetyltransferase (GNAT) family protein n=1 Tax=Aquabacter spiritensis TaxID=933073 RepID=A0A4R3M2Y7_9HYPH|nr:GNAT family N-acetyltransferase [Aquabacter spiritensis]TCT05627.1 acetyltransferase (GNAT) family protein [Aquabacter spiritensis]